MLSGYELRSDYDKKNAMKEIIQEIILCSLSRTDFFKHAAFYGGTALRIFYGLDRFSEDLDFSLLAPARNFDLSSYLPALESEVRSYGLNLRAEVKTKTKNSFVQSAFVKGNTREQLLFFYPEESLSELVPGNETVKAIKEFLTYESARDFSVEQYLYYVAALDEHDLIKLMVAESHDLVPGRDEICLFQWKTLVLRPFATFSLWNGTVQTVCLTVCFPERMQWQKALSYVLPRLYDAPIRLPQSALVLSTDLSLQSILYAIVHLTGNNSLVYCFADILVAC